MLFRSVSDQWISASSLAAPEVTSANRSVESRLLQSKGATLAIQSLDSYLAHVSSDIGPSLAVDQLDWSTFLPVEEAVEEKDHFALSLAIDDILGSLL